jgi:hypothetical protein
MINAFVQTTPFGLQIRNWFFGWAYSVNTRSVPLQTPVCAQFFKLSSTSNVYAYS